MLKFTANPTFKATVTVPTTDGPQTVKVTFKYKDADEWAAFVKDKINAEAKMTDVMAELIESWEDAEEPCSPESMAKLAKVHPAAPNALYEAYISALTQGKLEN